MGWWGLSWLVARGGFVNCADRPVDARAPAGCCARRTRSFGPSVTAPLVAGEPLGHHDDSLSKCPGVVNNRASLDYQSFGRAVRDAKAELAGRVRLIGPCLA